MLIALALLVSGPSPSGQAAESARLDRARSSITCSELREHVQLLADDLLEGREAGSRGAHEAAKYVVQQLQKAGLQPAGEQGGYLQFFHHNSKNLLAQLPGHDPQLQAEYIIIGAHYDHVGYGTRRNSYGPIGFIHNGADDNASGVAALLEVIDALTRTEHQPRRSILFAFWDAEEKGLLGSKHWVSHPTMQLDAVKLSINVDMVGRLTEGRIEVGGTRSGAGLRRLMSSSELSAGTWLDFSWEYKNNSDHWTFFQAAVPSVYVHTGVHGDYHRPSDDAEKLNIEGMQEVSRYLLKTLVHLADVDQLPGFRHAAHRETPHAQQRLERPLPPLVSRLGIQWIVREGQPVISSVQRLESGLMAGDRILRVNGRSTADTTVLPALAMSPEKSVELEISRAGTDMPLRVTLALEGQPVRLGLAWREDPAEPDTVLVSRVVPYSPAARAGIRVFDRICGLNGHPIQGQANLLERVQAVLTQQQAELQLEVESNGVVQEVTVSLQPAGTHQLSDPAI